MAAVPGQPAPKPSQLGAKVPNDDERQMIEEMLSSVQPIDFAGTEEGQGSPAPEQMQEVEQMAAQVDPEQIQPPAAVPPLRQIDQGEFDPESELTGIDRVRSSFATNEVELQGFLQKRFGEENVMKTADGFVWRENPGAKWKQVDIPNFSMQDFLDASRLGVEVGSDIFFRIAQGPLGATPAGGAFSASASFLVGQLGQELAGVPLDPNRSLTQEGLIAGTLGAAATPGAASIARSAGQTAAGTVKKGVGKGLNLLQKPFNPKAVEKRLLEQEAKEAMRIAEGSLPMKYTESLIQAEQDSILINQELVDMGARKVPVGVLAAEMSPAAKEFKDILSQEGNENALKIILDLGTNLGKGFQAAFGVSRTATQTLGKRIKDTFKYFNDSRGALIGRHRDATREIVGKNPIPIEASNKFFADSTSRMGLRVQTKTRTVMQKQVGAFATVEKPVKEVTQSLEPLTDEVVKRIKRKTGIKDRGQIEELYDFYSRFYKLSNKKGGRLTIDELTELTDDMAKSLDGSNPMTDKAFRKEVSIFKSNLIDDWDEIIDKTVNEMDEPLIRSWRQVKQEYATFKSGVKDLPAIAKRDELHSKALTDYIFKPGVNTMDRLTSVRTMLDIADPGLYDDLITSHLDDIVRGTEKGIGREINWLQALNKFESIPSDVKQEMFRGRESLQKFYRSYLRVGARWQKIVPDQELTKSQRGTLAGDIAVLAAEDGFVQTKLGVLGRLMSYLGRDKAVLTYLKTGGIEEVVRRIKPGKREGVRSILTDITMAGLSAPAREKLYGPLRENFVPFEANIE